MICRVRVLRVALTLSVKDLKSGLKKFEFEGPLVVTHWGLSGPAVLEISAFAARQLSGSKYNARLFCDFMVGTSKHELDELLRRFAKASSKCKLGKFSPFGNLSRRFWTKVLEQSIGSTTKNWSDVSHKDISRITDLLKKYPFDIHGKDNSEEFVTAGGLDLKEFDFRTMEINKIRGLYAAGEVTNIDGVTGGVQFPKCMDKRLFIWNISGK